MIVASLALIVAAAVLLVVGLLRDANLLLVVSIVVSLLAAVALYVGARRSKDDERAGPGEPGTDGPARSARADGAPRSSSADGTARAVAADGAARSTEAEGAAVSADTEGAPRSADAGGASTDTADDPSREVRMPVGARAGNASPAAPERPDWPPTGRGSRTRAATDSPTAEAASRGAARDQASARDRDAIRDQDADEPTDEPPVQRTPRGDADLISRLPAEVLVVDGRPRYHVTGCPHLLDRDSEPLPVSEAVELGFSPCGWCQPDTVLLGGSPDH